MLIWTHPTLPQAKVKPTMMTIKELKDSLYADVDWVTLINSLMFRSGSKVAIDQDQIIVTNPTFITKLKELMEKTPSKTVANFIGLIILSHVIGEDISALEILSNLEKGNKEIIKDCGVFLSWATLFSKASSALYVKKYFSSEQKTLAEDILNMTMSEMKLLPKDIKWMDNNTKTKAIKKLDSMKSYVGYHDEVLDKNEMFAYHDSFLEPMNSKSFINNQVSKHYYQTQAKAGAALQTPM